MLSTYRLNSQNQIYDQRESQIKQQNQYEVRSITTKNAPFGTSNMQTDYRPKSAIYPSNPMA
jgi:hypothetical protein